MSKKEHESTTTTTTNAPASQLRREHQEQVNKALDQIRDNIRKTTNKAKKDVSEYNQQVTTLQESAIETTADIAERYIESQREIINSFNQALWTPYLENVVDRTAAFPRAFSPPQTEVYTNIASNIFDNLVTATQLVNKTVFTNAELLNTSLAQARTSAGEYSRIGVNAAKNFYEAANEVAEIGFSTVSTRRQ